MSRQLAGGKTFQENNFLRFANFLSLYWPRFYQHNHFAALLK